MRYSKQRSTILEVLQGTDSHPTAEWIFENVRRTVPDISLGTVYRNLNQLADGNLIQRLYDDGFVRYDGNTARHDHFRCGQCQKIFDIDIPLGGVEEFIARDERFRANDYSVEIIGVCTECQINNEKESAMSLKVGDNAPRFTGEDADKKALSLGDYHGTKNVFLVFYPLAFSSVCSVQLPNYNRNLEGFHQRDTEVIAVSADSGLSQEAFCASLGGIDFPMLSDRKLQIADLYGVALPDGFTNRAEFLIDKAGVLRWINVEQSPGDDTPAIDEIFNAIDSLS
jgi:Fe2+ or Zn2+ uptake regulation protein/peroxiredoxin